MYKPEDFRSIGWLNMHVPEVVRLTPILNNAVMPISVFMPRVEFNVIRGDKKLMLEKACELLNQGLGKAKSN